MTKRRDVFKFYQYFYFNLEGVMKKIAIVFLSVVLFSQTTWALDLIPQVGIDIPTSVGYDKMSDQDTRRGYNIGVQLRGELTRYFSWGAGAEYLFARGLTNQELPYGYYEKSDFSFLPVYGSVIFYPLADWEPVKPYLKASIGYSILASNEIGENMSGGLYYSGSIGTEYKNFVAELTAARYAGKFKEFGETIKMDYLKIGFTLGYKISL